MWSLTVPRRTIAGSGEGDHRVSREGCRKTVTKNIKNCQETDMFMSLNFVIGRPITAESGIATLCAVDL